MSAGFNELCECAAPGNCPRHGITKSARQFELCAGVNCTPQQCAKYWDAWEHGRMPGQTGAVAEPQRATAAIRKPVRGLGDRVSRTISKATFGLVQTCRGCKGREAWLNHWFPADLPPIEPVSLDEPRRHLMFHIWPAKANGSWQWNCDRLLQYRQMFNGRRIVAIATSREADDADAVREYLRDLTDEFIVLPNNPKLREVVTWLPMLERLEPYHAPEDVTFTCHSKGVRHRVETDSAGSTIFRWTAAMYELCLNWQAVRPLLETHATVGSFRRYGTPRRGGFGPWHFSGTFYWFRNLDAFRRNWRYVPKSFFGTEAWPGLMFKPEEAGVICCDDVGDLYKLDYWNREMEPQLATWRQLRREIAG